MSAPQPVTFHNFNPDILGGYIAQKNWDGCWGYLVQLIESFSAKKSGSLTFGSDSEASEGRDYINNFGSLMGDLLFSLLSDPSTKIPDQSFYKLIYLHEIIHNFLRFRGCGNTDDLVREMLKKKKGLSPTQQKKMLLLYRLDTELDVISVLSSVSKSYQAAAFGAYLGTVKIYKEAVHANKVKLLKRGNMVQKLCHNLNDSALVEKTVSTLISCYFLSSYLDDAEKHQIKIPINEGLARYIEKEKRKAAKIDFPVPSIIRDAPPSADKPRIFIVLEQFHSTHAMKRSWGLWIKSLESQFHVVIALHKNIYNADLEAEYNIFSFTHLPELLSITEEYAPDMMILPSVGLSFWGIAASVSRIAPVQMMTLGHPATSMSAKIDFVYGQSDLYDSAAFPRDRYIIDDAPYRFTPNISKTDLAAIPVESYQAAESRALRVAIVGSECKMTPTFFKLLQEINADSDFEIEFSFHLGSASIDGFIIESDLKAMFPHVRFHTYQDYTSFLTSIARSDIVLNPFPFGHTNTIIDTLLLGKPCVSYQGVEPAARTEAYILRSTGLADQFLVTNLQDYKERFFDLAARIMSGDTEFYDADAVYDILYDPGRTSGIDYGAHVKAIYMQAQNMLQSDQSVFDLSDLMNNS